MAGRGDRGHLRAAQASVCLLGTAQGVKTLQFLNGGAPQKARNLRAVVQSAPHSPEGRPVAKPNYSFEKRQRELAKKKKKEEKLKEKAERKTGPDRRRLARRASRRRAPQHSAPARARHGLS